MELYSEEKEAKSKYAEILFLIGVGAGMVVSALGISWLGASNRYPLIGTIHIHLVAGCFVLITGVIILWLYHKSARKNTTL